MSNTRVPRMLRTCLMVRRSSRQSDALRMADPELDFAEVRRAFDHAAASYDAHAVLQREVCDRLLERLDFMTLQPGRVLDVGTGTGYGLAALRSRYAEAELCALDIAPSMLAAARARFPQPGWGKRVLTRLTPLSSPLTHLVCADMERLPLAADSVNLVWSSLALQWARDLEAAFRGLHRALAPGGLLIFATFGPDTLKELRAACAEIDDAQFLQGIRTEGGEDQQTAMGVSGHHQTT